MNDELNPDTAPAEDVITIMIATDNHLGFAEKDPVRKDDSMNTFEEILQLAQTHQVDMILLGGDLFHENKPSIKTMHGAMQLLRKYCLGDKPSYLKFLSNPNVNFHHEFGTVNYLDPNYNVSIPVFSIHGNHDDPTGDGNYASLDLLSTTGLVNYFGRVNNVDDINLSPILLQKGITKTAIYGLGSIRDERLYRSFLREKVRLLQPEEYTDDWFNIMCVHQNRSPHGKTNYLPESFLSDRLHLVLWGHEHECLIGPQWNSDRNFYITQPGSSIATTLTEGEAKKKNVAILRVYKTAFTMKIIPLRTVRPFVIQDMILAEEPRVTLGNTKLAHNVIDIRIKDMINSACSEWVLDHAAMDSDTPPLPLIRLRVEYTGFTPFNTQQFGQQYVSKVANPREMILFFRKRTKTGMIRSHAVQNIGQVIDFDDVDDDVNVGQQQDMHVGRDLSKNEAQQLDDLIKEKLKGSKLFLLPEAMLHDVVKVFVEKHDNSAIGDFASEIEHATTLAVASIGESVAENDELLNQSIYQHKRQTNANYGSDSSNAYMETRKSGGVVELEDSPPPSQPVSKSRRKEPASSRGRRGTSIVAKRAPQVPRSSATKRRAQEIDSDSDENGVEELIDTSLGGPIHRSLPSTLLISSSTRSSVRRGKK